MPNEIVDVGKAIKALRSRRGLTLDDVARQSGCTPGFISQIEHHNAAPSITTLQSIAAALGASIADFFPADINQSKVVRRDLDESIQFEGSTTKYSVLSTKFSHSGLAAFLMTIKREDQALLTDELRAHIGEEFFFVIEGVMRLWIGNGFYDLHRGNSVYFKSTTKHRLENRGQRDVEVLSLVTPSIF